MREVLERRGPFLRRMDAKGKWRLAAVETRFLAIIFWMLLNCCFFSSGFLALVWGGQKIASGFRFPPEFTVAELASREVYTTPLRIMVDVVPPEEIELANPGAYAYTNVFQNPCHVVLPSGMQLRFDLERRQAIFADLNAMQAVAHEFLHCYRGAWHSAWPDGHM